LRIGKSTLEVKASKRGKGYEHWVNGVEGGELPHEGDSFDLEGYTVEYTRSFARRHSFHVDLGSQNHIKIATFKDFILVKVDAFTGTEFSSSSGMMGSFPKGLRFARDGVTVVEDAIVFGKEWQVRSDELKLFHTYEGAVQAPQQCVMPDEKQQTASKQLKKRRLGEAAISEDQAAIGCALVDEDDRDSCIYDVIATQDLDMVAVY